MKSELGIVFLIVALSACVLVGALFAFSSIIENSLHNADRVELTEHFRRWVEAGSPQGEDLINFLRGRRRDLVVSNCLFAINGTNYFTQFAVTDLHSHRAGLLFVTTNGLLIFMDGYGHADLQTLTRRR